MTLRARYGKIIAQAAENGYRDADTLWSCTPDEAANRIAAFAEEERGKHVLAWMIGAYTACATRSPGRYPACPDRKKPMSDEAMRDAMKAFSAKKGGKE